MLEFGQYFAADVLYVKVMKLNLGRDSEARLGQDFEVEIKARIEAGVWSFFFC